MVDTAFIRSSLDAAGQNDELRYSLPYLHQIAAAAGQMCDDLDRLTAERDRLAARVCTVADEACGLGVRTAEESLTSIEAELFRGRQEREALLARATAAEQECERLRAAQINATDRDYTIAIHERDAAESEAARLREALEKYGRHLSLVEIPCETRMVVHGHPCSCGLDAALARGGDKEGA